jgi:hypothetical protein
MFSDATPINNLRDYHKEDPIRPRKLNPDSVFHIQVEVPDSAVVVAGGCTGSMAKLRLCVGVLEPSSSDSTDASVAYASLNREK